MFPQPMSPLVEKTVNKMVCKFLREDHDRDRIIVCQYGGSSHIIFNSQDDHAEIFRRTEELYRLAHPIIFNPDNPIIIAQGITTTLIVKYADDWGWMTLTHLEEKVLVPFFDSCGLVARRFMQADNVSNIL